MRKNVAEALARLGVDALPVLKDAYETGKLSSDRSAAYVRMTVMSAYLELAQTQRTLVEQWPVHAPMPAAEPPLLPSWPSTHARDSRTPLLDTIVEHDETHVLARCSVGLLNDNFIRDHVMSGPVSERTHS
mgnify:CR=1 FL=1